MCVRNYDRHRESNGQIVEWEWTTLMTTNKYAIKKEISDPKESNIVSRNLSKLICFKWVSGS